VRAGAESVDRQLEVAVGEGIVERTWERARQRPAEAHQQQADVAKRRVRS
jgi:hypothetical protein